jgi:hypothetical protein
MTKAEIVEWVAALRARFVAKMRSKLMAVAIAFAKG